MKLAELPQVIALSPAEKLDLIGELWESLDQEQKQVEVSEQEKKMLDDRWEQFLANPESALTLEQMKALMAARRK
jgi:putative addiction module component (TIGR02574 family)